jgi:antitoxin component YwqK of YwqJK toxin-antitoxin module
MLPLTLTLLFSCKEQSDRITKDLKSGEFSEKEIETCDCSELNSDSTSTYFRDTIPFTGVCKTYYPNSKDVMEEKPFLKGKIHGDYIVYAPETHEAISSVKYQNGEMSEDNLNKNSECECKEIEQTKQKNGEALFTRNGQPFTGKCYNYSYDSTTIVLEQYFEDGLAHGDMMIYNNEGKLIQMERYQKGKSIRSQFFTQN